MKTCNANQQALTREKSVSRIRFLTIFHMEKPWSVHRGQAFCRNVFSDSPRAPNEHTLSF
jgi:hypothetical protein